jgi:hypothetical protein
MDPADKLSEETARSSEIEDNCGDTDEPEDGNDGGEEPEPPDKPEGLALPVIEVAA